MKKIDYSIIKQEYQNIELITKQNKWNEIRASILASGGDSSLYPKEIGNLLIADFDSLAKIYVDYNRIKTKLSNSLLNDISDYFRYNQSRKVKIMRILKKNAIKLGISSCYYCDLSYINVYKSKNGQYTHFDLDHILPKSKCPIVALSLYNLIPCCPVCNQRLKKAKILGSDAKSLSILSPTSTEYAFDEQVLIHLFPKTSQIGVRFIDHPENFKIHFLTHNEDYQKQIEMFRLEERYDFHKIEALNLLDLMRKYPPSHIRMIQKAFVEEGGFYTTKQIKEDIFRQEFIEKNGRILTKLNHDIMRLYDECENQKEEGAL